MGIFDFLSDLSKSGKNDLGLGGLKSLLGTRGAAPAGSRGDEMMSKTSEDSLPGYFDPNTREYVPWYVDLFNGGGLNSSEGLLAAPTAEMPAADAGLLGGGRVQRGAGVQAQARPALPRQDISIRRLHRDAQYNEYGQRRRIRFASLGATMALYFFGWHSSFIKSSLSRG